MAVSLDESGIRHNATDVDECPFVLVDAQHPDGLDAVAAMREAVPAVNARAETEWTEDGLSPTGSRPSVLPKGPGSSVFWDGEPELTVAWCRGLCDALTEAGWDGRIEPIPWGAYPEPITTGLSMTAVLAVSGYGLRRNGTAYPLWRTGPEHAERLTDLACTWLDGMHGQDRLDVMAGPPVEASPSELRQALHAALADQEERAFFEVSRSDSRPAERSAKFWSDGHVFLGVREPGDEVAERLAALTAAATGWAAMVEHAFVAGTDWDAAHRRTTRPEPHHAGLRREHGAERLPDAFAWQIVTSRHLDAAHDVSGWRIDEVAGDRFALAHPDPWAWFQPDPDHAGATMVDHEVLAQARSDLDGMLGPVGSA